MMKPRRMLSVLVLALCAAMFASACSGSASGAGNTGTPPTAAPTATATATATPKPKPAGAPVATTATCQTLMTLSEANQIMSPPSPATTLQANSSADYGVCNYLGASNALVLKIFLETYTGPVPVSQATLQSLLAQLAQDPHVTITSATNVAGVGDQAAYLAASMSSGGYSLDAHVFYTITGKVIFGCLTYKLNGVGLSGTQSQLQQCAQQVVSRL